MKYLLTILLSAVLCCSNIQHLPAQEFIATPVEISSEKVRIKGELYYVHKVLKGQTLYSIAKTYEVTTDDINKANPSLIEGLKSGTMIYIPAATGKSEEKPAPAATEVAEQEKVTESKEVKEEVQSQNVNNEQRYVVHKLKWYESLKDVAKKYGVPLEAIYSLNNIVPPSKTRIKTVLIPDELYIREMSLIKEQPEQQEDRVETPAEEVVVEESVADNKSIFSMDNSTVESPVYDYGTKGQKFTSPVKITVILPFNVAEGTENLTGYIADFYCGMLLATDHLKENGAFDGFVLETVDLSDYSSAWDMLSSGVLEGSQLIIGPVSVRDMHPVSTYCQNNKIPFVSPLDNKTSKLLEGNPYMFLFPSTTEQAIERQVEKIAEHSSDTQGQSVTIIYEKGYDESHLMTSTANALQSQGINYNTFKYDFLQGRDIDSVMSRSLDSLKLNKVIIPSHSEAFISDALRNLHLIQSKFDYKVEVYGMSRWKSMETLDVDYFHQLNLHLAVPYHIDYNDGKTTKFINGYLAAFNTEPTPFSYQGYDILTFFVDAMNKYGKNFPAEIMNSDAELIQSDVRFVPTSYGSGAENKALKDIVYKKGWIISKYE